MNVNYHRIHVRLSERDYELFKEKSAEANLTMNKYAMRLLGTIRPINLPWEQAQEFMDLMTEAGRDINRVAHAFNAGFGMPEQLHFAVKRLGTVVQSAHAVVEKKKEINASYYEETAKTKRRSPRKTRDDARYIMLRLSGEQYTRLKVFMAETRLNQATLFRKLIGSEPLHVNLQRKGFSPCAAANMIYSNVRQIARNKLALEMDGTSVQQLVFLINNALRLVEEMMR